MRLTLGKIRLIMHLVYLPLLQAFLSITALATSVGCRLFATARQNTLMVTMTMMMVMMMMLVMEMGMGHTF